MSYSLAHVSHCAPSLDPLLGKAMKCTYFFSLLASVYRTNTNHELITHLRAECSDSMFSKVSLVRSSFFTVCYLPYHQKEQKSLPHHFGKIQVFAALLWSTGTFSKGDGECDWGVSIWHLWITEIVGAAGGAAASNGSLIFLDVERQDPLSDSPQLEKAGSAGWEYCKY